MRPNMIHHQTIKDQKPNKTKFIGCEHNKEFQMDKQNYTFTL